VRCIHTVEVGEEEEGERSDLDWMAELREEEQLGGAEKSCNHGLAQAAAD